MTNREGATPASGGSLQRRLGLADATVLGIAAMLGAGVFAAFTPAAQAAGSGLLIGLAVAGFVAFANATSSAQLAAEYPESGGTYVYGRRVLGQWWGFAAGWSFVIGKTASCAAMAMTFAAYASPPGWEKPVAVAAVVALAGVNLVGVSRTAAVARVLVTIVLIALAVVVAAGFASTSDGSRGLTGDDLPGSDASGFAALVDPGAWIASGPYGMLQSAGLLFFAVAGYARIATMGEEVREPRTTIPRAIVLALVSVLVVYALVGSALLVSLGADGVAGSATPLFDVVRDAGWEWAGPVVRVGAAAASLGALLALIAGVGRTSLAMARAGDFPRWLSAVHPRFGVPQRAEVALALVVVAVVLIADVRAAIGFSSFGVLLYYVIANLSAWRQPRDERRWPQWLQVLGIIGCLTLVVTLPIESVLVGAGVLAIGLLLRLAIVTRRARVSR